MEIMKWENRRIGWRNERVKKFMMGVLILWWEVKRKKNWKNLGIENKELIDFVCVCAHIYIYIERERESLGFVKSDGIKSLGGEGRLIWLNWVCEGVKHHFKTRK